MHMDLFFLVPACCMLNESICLLKFGSFSGNWSNDVKGTKCGKLAWFIGNTLPKKEFGELERIKPKDNSLCTSVYQCTMFSFIRISVSHTLEIHKSYQIVIFQFTIYHFHHHPKHHKNHHQFYRNRMMLVFYRHGMFQNMTFSLLQQILPGLQRWLWQSHR